MSDRPRSHQL